MAETSFFRQIQTRAEMESKYGFKITDQEYYRLQAMPRQERRLWLLGRRRINAKPS
jgi:hypothetical protein